MQPTPSAIQDNDDEINLLELWQTLVKRRYIIYACFLVCLAAGIAYAWLKPPVYEANIKVRVGQVQGASGLLESIEELKLRILADHGSDVADGVERERPYIAQASTQKGLNTTLELTAEGDTPEDAARILRDVTQGIIQRHTAILDDNLAPIKARVKSVNEQIQALQQQYDDITQLVEQLRQRDSVQASIAMIERGPILDAISSHEDERMRLETLLSPPATRVTKMLGDIVAPAEPAKPKKRLILVLAAVMGLMGGVMLALVAEFLANAKKYIRS